MEPTTFPESNCTLYHPESMTAEECGPLEVWKDKDRCVSCWRLSLRERLSALLFGRVWLHVNSWGGTQPPVWLMAKRSVFESPGDES